MNITRAAVSLVLSELDLGATFCEVALCTQDEKTKERNIRNARKAYETALHLLQRLSLGAEQAYFDEKALHLKGLFEQLGLNPDDAETGQVKSR
jgi:ribosome assembly protein YihI (activator of Der GTPase)